MNVEISTVNDFTLGQYLNEAIWIEKLILKFWQELTSCPIVYTYFTAEKILVDNLTFHVTLPFPSSLWWPTIRNVNLLICIFTFSPASIEEENSSNYYYTLFTKFTWDTKMFWGRVICNLVLMLTISFLRFLPHSTKILKSLYFKM